jgi:predicted DNA-binding transcriptional regulator YafY
MMQEKEMTRLSRLTAIVTLLQSKKLITASTIAEKFGISIRTVYRDIKALNEAEIPILTEEGKGYSLMEGYRLSPVLFTEEEANALITAEQFILKNKDASLIKNYSNAISKIKAILRYNTKDKVDLLSQRIVIGQNFSNITTSNFLTDIQKALTDFFIIELQYKNAEAETITTRKVEPFAVYNSTEENWILIAWCRLRNDFRTFRLDRMMKMTILQEQFEQHKLSLAEYIEIERKKYMNP